MEEEVAKHSLEPPLTEKEKLFCDKTCLLRYLRANSWNNSKALTGLTATLKWRREFKPDEITAKDIEAELRAGKMYVKGFTKKGHPLMVTKKSQETKSVNYDAQLKLLVYTMEKAISLMPEGIEQWVWILDMNNYSRANSPPISASLETLKIFSNHYPERLYKCLLVDAPWVFSFFYKILRPFIDRKTAEKIEWVSGEAGVGTAKTKAFQNYIADEELFPEYGGSSKWTYDYDTEFGSATLSSGEAGVDTPVGSKSAVIDVSSSEEEE